MTLSPRWLLCFVLCALFPASAQRRSSNQPLAQRERTNAAVGQSFMGHYEGTATNKAKQVIPLAIDLTDAGGNLSGEISSTFGLFRIVGGTHHADAITIEFDVGGEKGTISAKLSDGQLFGTFN